MNVDYKQLRFFIKAHQLTLEIYKVTNEFPREETYSLTNQLRRACVSIGSNISEGSSRSTDKDWKHFLSMALGSAKEVEYQLLVAKDLNYISISSYDRLLIIVNEVIGSLINYMKKIK